MLRVAANRSFSFYIHVVAVPQKKSIDWAQICFVFALFFLSV